VYRLAQRSYEPLDWVQFPTGIFLFLYISLVPVVYRLAQRSYEPLDWVQFPTGIFLFNNFLKIIIK
jgi:hypothetical protein